MSKNKMVKSFDIPEDIKKKWQNVMNIAAEMMNVPAALIMRYKDPEIEVLISSASEGNPYEPGAAEKLEGSGLYCERVIKTADMLMVPDALSDPEWEDNPDIKLNMISYLGFPLQLPDGSVFGTICVLDSKKNKYSNTYIDFINALRSIIINDINLLHMNWILGEKNARLEDYLVMAKALRGLIPICAECKKVRNVQGRWSEIEDYLKKHSEIRFTHGICAECEKKLYGDSL
ncbi:MAG: GAF domain-containing protein [Elusimicrobiota bacterium]